MEDPKSDIDFAATITSPPEKAADACAKLSLELEERVFPLQAELLFCVKSIT